MSRLIEIFSDPFVITAWAITLPFMVVILIGLFLESREKGVKRDRAQRKPTSREK